MTTQFQEKLTKYLWLPTIKKMVSISIYRMTDLLAPSRVEKIGIGRQVKVTFQGGIRIEPNQFGESSQYHIQFYQTNPTVLVELSVGFMSLRNEWILQNMYYIQLLFISTGNFLVRDQLIGVNFLAQQLFTYIKPFLCRPPPKLCDLISLHFITLYRVKLLIS